MLQFGGGSHSQFPQSLDVLPFPVWHFYRFSCFLSQAKTCTCTLRLTRNAKLLRDVCGWCVCPVMTSQPVRGGFRVETRCNSNSQWLICLVYSRESWGWLRQLREFFWSRVNMSYLCKWHYPLQTGSLVQRWQSWLETKAKNWLSANWVAKASVAFFPHRSLIKMLLYKGGCTRAFSALNKVSPNEYIWG